MLTAKGIEEEGKLLVDKIPNSSLLQILTVKATDEVGRFLEF